MLSGFGLRNIKTEELARLWIFSNEGKTFCGNYTYELSLRPEDNIYITSFENAIATMVEDTPWFNSNENRPTWGRFSMEDYEIVFIEIPDPIINKVDYKIPPLLSSFYEGRPFVVDYKGGHAFVGTLKSIPTPGTILYCGRGFIEVIENVEDGNFKGKSFLVIKDIRLPYPTL